MTKNIISENDIEQETLKKLQQHCFQRLNCYTPKQENINDRSNRQDKRDVILSERLNPSIPEPTIDNVIETIMDRRTAMPPLAANMQLYSLIRDGVPVEFEDAQGIKHPERVQLIDFENHYSDANASNDYLAVSQLWIKTTAQTPKAAYRRPDIILYINGLPLVISFY
ncbi:hypothetical protein PN36_12385 [Candidatus Thiomargarita nelsonii]|uniref:type I site-specific deoxyribonuclease n=1 Tax=Candidatus Thiomargarita nelsonii TaxID=1003181 RepID=A0A4E0QPR2_9GAMM|nr:hypothetical protein PN36_12385 [Candidatus Thiomargarita nelsonii]